MSHRGPERQPEYYSCFALLHRPFRRCGIPASRARRARRGPGGDHRAAAAGCLNGSDGLAGRILRGRGWSPWPSGPVASARAWAVPRIMPHRGRQGGSTSSTTRAACGLCWALRNFRCGRSPGRRCQSRPGRGCSSSPGAQRAASRRRRWPEPACRLRPPSAGTARVSWLRRPGAPRATFPDAAGHMLARAEQVVRRRMTGTLLRELATARSWRG
jgi:hypothetical protein